MTWAGVVAGIERPERGGLMPGVGDALLRYTQDPALNIDNPPSADLRHAAERAIRRPVIPRKNSYRNRSGQGADIQALPMRAFFTLKKRGHNPVNGISHAIK